VWRREDERRQDAPVSGRPEAGYRGARLPAPWLVKTMIATDTDPAAGMEAVAAVALLALVALAVYVGRAGLRFVRSVRSVARELARWRV
jgi:hypothetical protein